jgi:hypothetical protein
MFGLLFRAATGFALAFGVLHPGAFASAIGPQRLAAVKADIASQQPTAHLQAAWNDLLAQAARGHGKTH